MYVAWVLFIEGRGLKWMYILCGHTVIINYSAQPSPLLLLLQKTVSFALKGKFNLLALRWDGEWHAIAFDERIFTHRFICIYLIAVFFIAAISLESLYLLDWILNLAQLIAQPGWVLFQRTTPKAETFLGIMHGMGSWPLRIFMAAKEYCSKLCQNHNFRFLPGSILSGKTFYVCVGWPELQLYNEYSRQCFPWKEILFFKI